MSYATHTDRTVGLVNRKGFTLIEMSIVLVIIALIVGATLVGKSLIRSAELLSITSDVRRFQNAVVMFKEKYKYLPGDMPTATTFWGTDSNCPNTSYTATPHIATCNGDGNGTITTKNASTGATDDTTVYESYRAWQQLSDAGMIDGSYNGIAAPGGAEEGLVGINIPASRLTGAGYTLYWLGSGVFASNAYFAGNNYGHVLLFGGNNGNYVAGAPVLTPSEAFGIDAKTDDGLPGSGEVTGPTNASDGWPNCATSAVQTTAAYNLAHTGIACRLMFSLGF